MNRKFNYCCCFLVLLIPFLHAQNGIYDQFYIDSLKQVYNTEIDSNNHRNLLFTIIQNETDPDEKLAYTDIFIKRLTKAKKTSKQRISKLDSTLYYLSTAYLHKGNALQIKGEFHAALEAYFKCITIAEEDKDEDFSATILISIADTYSMIGNSESAEKYYNKGINLLRKVNDPLALASALLNAGDEYYKTGQYDKALSNFAESEDLFEQENYPIGKAYNVGNIGMVYAKQGKHELAKTNMNTAITLLENNEDYYAISEFLNYISEVYVEQNNYDVALEYAERSLELASQYNLKDQISDANLQLSMLLERAGNAQDALARYKTHIIYRDSILNLENQEKIFNSEVARNDLVVQNLEQKRKTERMALWSTLGALFLIGLLAYGLFKRNKFVRATNKIISSERERSDKLLLNILPEATAQELKDKGRVEAKQYPSVTVLFSDFKGFTSYAENLSPEDLVKTIDYYFSKFDLIMEKYGLEKIKTIGDAYMAVGGLNFATTDQAKEMVLAAKEMADFVDEAKEDTITDATFDIRIGINTGPVVAGVVGSKKFAYDIWGDTVNIASRMESNSEPGCINISENTYNVVKNDYHCEYRGEIAVKNRGELKMYFIR